MTQEQLTAFIAYAKGDKSLQEKLKAAADFDAVAAIAKAEGFSISTDDLKKAQSEVSEEELEGGAGGGSILSANTKCFICVTPCTYLSGCFDN